MVFSVNADPDSDKSFADFQNLAVWQNGTGVVQPFGPSAAVSAPSSTPSTYSAGSGSKDVSSVLKAVSGDSDDSDASMLKKLNNLAPVVLGLLGAILALLVAVLIVGIVLLRRSPTKGYTEILPTRNVSPSYSQVPVTMPSSKMRSDGTHDYNEPFIAPARYD